MDTALALTDLSEADVNPPREVRSTDVQRLSFPLQLVVAIAIGAMSATATGYAVTYGLRSDVRDILTRMEMQSKLDESKGKLQEQAITSLRESIDSMKRRQELQQYEIQGLKEAIMLGVRPKPAPPIKEPQE